MDATQLLRARQELQSSLIKRDSELVQLEVQVARLVAQAKAQERKESLETGIIVTAAAAILSVSPVNFRRTTTSIPATPLEAVINTPPVATPSPSPIPSPVVAPPIQGTQAERNLHAFMQVIRYGEGTLGDRGYRTNFGGGYIRDLSRHPRNCVKFIWRGKENCSTAAGIGQFVAGRKGTGEVRTWERLVKKLGLKDFSPASQDRAFLELIKESGAYSLAQQGQLEAALSAASSTWASLPKSASDTQGVYNQAVKPYADLERLFIKTGGVLAPTPKVTLTQRNISRWQKDWQRYPKVGDTISGHPISSLFGPRWGRIHAGVDLAAPVGTPIFAPYSSTGKVLAMCWYNSAGGGNVITLFNPDYPEVQLDLLHLHTCNFPRKKVVEVKSGSAIATIGNTGKSTGPHLHLTVRFSRSFNGKIAPGAGEKVNVRLGWFQMLLSNQSPFKD